MDMECLLCMMTRFLERNTADWHKRIWMDLMPVTYTLKMALETTLPQLNGALCFGDYF